MFLEYNDVPAGPTDDAGTVSSVIREILTTDCLDGDRVVKLSGCGKVLEDPGYAAISAAIGVRDVGSIVTEGRFHASLNTEYEQSKLGSSSLSYMGKGVANEEDAGRVHEDGERKCRW